MTESGKEGRQAPSADDKPRDAEWTKGLKRLYDSVVDEPLPDAFRDLLSKLDSEG